MAAAGEEIGETDFVDFAEIRIRDPLPYRTQPYFYYGRTPVQHVSGPRVAVKVLRVTADWTPRRILTLHSPPW